jgi:N-acetylmuramoyl-L-alanine amidase
MKYILSAGHSGMAFGQYYTAGKRSPDVPPGIYEGEFNRIIVDLVYWGMQWDDDAPIAVCKLNMGVVNVPIVVKRKTINQIVKTEARLGNEVALIEIHANAMGNKGWHPASGSRVFVPKMPMWGGSAKKQRVMTSIALAQKITNKFDTDDRIPYNTRSIKEANFAMLNVHCPAVLVECGFMTNRGDVGFMASSYGQDRIAFAIADAIADMEGKSE